MHGSRLTTFALGAIGLLGLSPALHAQSGSDFKVYATLPNSNSVAIIDGLTNTVVSTIAVPAGAGTGPFSVALTPDARFAYVVNGQGCNDGATFGYGFSGANPVQGFVWVLDTASNSAVAVIPVDLCPQEIAITPDGTRAYVTNFGSNTLSVIDISTNTVLKSIGLPDTPDGLAISPDGSSIYVATFSSVSVVSTATNAIVANILPPDPTCDFSELAVTPDGQQVYVTSNACASAFVINTQTKSVVSSFPSQSFLGPWGIAITPDGKQAYLASHDGVFGPPQNSNSGETFVIGTSTLGFAPYPMCRFEVGKPSACTTNGVATGTSLPIFVEITPDGKEAYFSANLINPVTGAIMVFDTSTNVATASVLFNTVPGGLAIGPATNTPAGTNIVVRPLDGATKTSPVTLTFSNVTQPGFTSLVLSSTGPTPPNGFQLGNPPIYYNLAATAAFSGNVIVCINYTSINFGSSPVALNEFENNTWVDVTTSVDAVNQIICGGATSLAPFAIFAGGQVGGPPAATKTTLASGANSSVFGQNVTFTATVTVPAPGSGTPTGIVNFLDGTTALGAVTLAGGQAVLSLSSLAAGPHSITAAYVGNLNFGGSTSLPLLQTVNTSPTTTTLSSSPNPSSYAQPITLTAAVTAAGTGMTGVVSFMSGGKVLGQGNLIAGVATTSVISGNVGTYFITAMYNGDPNFNSSTSAPLTQVVTTESTSCRVEIFDASNPNLTVPEPFDLANIDVQVLAQNPSGLITGITIISDNGTVLTQLPGLGSSAEFAIGQDVFTPGTHKYIGAYEGDSNNNPSQQCILTLTVPKARSSVTLTSSANPATPGQTVVFSVKVTSPTGRIPSGNVTISDGGTPLVTTKLDSLGTASYSTSSLSSDIHTITATYGGDQNFTGSSATLTQTVQGGNGGGGNGGGTCNCTKTGNYVNPVQAIGAITDAQKSSKGKYSVAATIDNTNHTTDLVVTLASDGSIVLDTGLLPITTHWGFSPDDDRFLYHYLSGIGTNNQLDNVFIYDLAASPARPIVFIAQSTQIAQLQFSPSGRYFLYTTLLGQSTTQLQIYRIQGVATQALVFQTVFPFAVGSGEDQFGAVNWGFSPDSPETSFVYAYVSGQSTFQWNVVNLTAYQRQVLTLAVTTIASFWQFDPCGDVIALVTQPSATQDQIDLYDTSKGQALQGSGQIVPSLSITLESTSSGQEVVFSGQTNLLSPPSCGQPNTPTGTNITVTSKDAGSATSPMDVTFASVTQAGQTSVTVSNTGAAAPTNFQLGNPPIYYDLTTTAVFSGGATVCINYSGISFTNQLAIRLYHFENGAWVDHTTSVNTATKTVCGAVNSFSPFALFEPTGPVPSNITPTAGTPQSANINTTFAATLQATVSDSTGSPVSGVTVTFMAPAVGATGTFAGGGALVSATTNASGVATSPMFTADGRVGSYSVSATVSGVSTAANFSLTNSSSPTTVSLSGPGSTTVYGGPVLFVAMVVSSAGAPTGTVAFSDGGKPLGTSSLTGVTASFTTSFLAAGAHSITASYSGDSNFTGSTSAALTQTVNPAPLITTANNVSRRYGQANPGFTASYNGFVNGDTLSALSGTLSCISTATPSSSVGSYWINCSGLSSSNYRLVYASGTLTIIPAPLTIAANNAARPYGANNPAFTGIFNGLQNADPISTNFTTAATPASAVGVYPITPVVLDPSNRLSNYAVTLVNGTITVVPETTSLNVTISPLSIAVGQSATLTVTLTAPDMVIPIDPSVLASVAVTSPIVSDILTNNGACALVPTGTGVATCFVTLTAIEPNGRTLAASFPGSSALGTSTGSASLIVTAPLESKMSCIKSDFRNVAVPGGSYLWLNSIFMIRDVNKQKVHITFFQSSVQFQYRDANNNLVTVNQELPDAKITIDPSVSTASTMYDAVDNVWITTVPLDTDDATFLTGIPWLVPAGGIPADIEPVTWCGTFASDTAAVDMGWRWSAAAYSSFSGDNNKLGIKPMNTDHDNPPANRDNAGTPENFKGSVIPGARGKGGKNYTGSYSGSDGIE